MNAVELELRSRDLATLLSEIRIWLDHRGSRAGHFEIRGATGHTVLHLEFGSAAEAEAFRKNFE